MSPPARRPRRAGRHERRRSPAQDDLPRSAGSLIAAALAARGLTDEIRARDVVLNWHTIVGPRIAARTQPDSLSQRVLYVRVASSAWMHELTLLRPQLLATIQAAMGTPRLVDELRLHLGARATSGPDPVREAARARALPPSRADADARHRRPRRRHRGRDLGDRGRRAAGTRPQGPLAQRPLGAGATA
jgi:hypothetical protein